MKGAFRVFVCFCVILQALTEIGVDAEQTHQPPVDIAQPHQPMDAVQTSETVVKTTREVNGEKAHQAAGAVPGIEAQNVTGGEGIQLTTTPVSVVDDKNGNDAAPNSGIETTNADTPPDLNDAGLNKAEPESTVAAHQKTVTETDSEKIVNTTDLPVTENANSDRLSDLLATTRTIDYSLEIGPPGGTGMIDDAVDTAPTFGPGAIGITDDVVVPSDRFGPDATGITDDVVVPSDRFGHDATGMTDGVVVPAGTFGHDAAGMTDGVVVPVGTFGPDAAGMTDGVVVPAGTFGPDAEGMTDGVIVPAGTFGPDAAGMTDGVVVPAGTFGPDAEGMTDGVIVPAGTFGPDAAGMTDGVVVPAGTFGPGATTIAESVFEPAAGTVAPIDTGMANGVRVADMRNYEDTDKANASHDKDFPRKISGDQITEKFNDGAKKTNITGDDQDDVSKSGIIAGCAVGVPTLLGVLYLALRKLINNPEESQDYASSTGNAVSNNAFDSQISSGDLP